MCANTFFLRLEGPLQSWGDQQSRFVVRRTSEAPTKSGVFGLLCAALGIERRRCAEGWLDRLGSLRMGVRIDRPGVRWWDYQTVGAGSRLRTADSTGKEGPLLSRREYLCDASFLVALQGESTLVAELERALREPCWVPYLGRKSCPPSSPILERPATDHPDVISALASVPWRPRLKGDLPPELLTCLLDWHPSDGLPRAPTGERVSYDVPVSFEPPVHRPRFVVRRELKVAPTGGVSIAKEPGQSATTAPPRPRADYANGRFRQRRKERLQTDRELCVLCKSPAGTVQHITYRRAGGDELLDDLRSMCRLCHDAATMVEYGHGMGIDRINPEDPKWRGKILAKRAEIVSFRSVENRRRRLSEG